MNNEELLRLAIVEGAKTLGIEVTPEELTIDRSKDPAHGDYASNLAMKSAKLLHKAPVAIANELIKAIHSPIIEKIEVAGPGFINFFLKKESLGSIIKTIIEQGDNYGQLPPTGKKINVEYVSANPTGNLHLGHTRGAALGDTVCNILEKAGNEVTREYYVNNCGNQVAHLGHSLGERYRELFGIEPNFDKDDYIGNDIIEIAKQLKEEAGDRYLEDNEENRAFFVQYGIDKEFAKIKKDMEDFGVHFDKFSFESDIRKGTTIEDTIKYLSDKGYTYSMDGATFLKTTDFLDDKDRPIVKADGSYTYFMPDICYHYNKMERGFDLLIDMLGADHFGYLNRMRSALMMKGYDPNAIEFGIYQIVRVYQNGVEVKMSKRTGKAITHRDLVSEVGKDAVRYYFAARNGDSHLDFNMDLATSKSKDNPVYYSQYAHARCASLLQIGAEFPIDMTGASLKNEKESDILKQLADFPSMIESSANLRAPYKVANYIEKLAALIHEYYSSVKIIDRNDPKGTSARLGLIKASMITLKNALAILGVSAPDKM
ncbi:MAG: arginine--tRNA ligase [Bacilli bacterium]|nr:arginine--tRNA ligase [Bacilli bacterium]